MGKKVIDGNLQVTGTITTSTPVQSTEVTTKGYVDSNLQNIMEVAEGKCSTFVLSYAETIADIKGKTVYDLDGNDISSAVQNGDYDSVTVVNSDFNSQNSSIEIGARNRYLIIKSAYMFNRSGTLPVTLSREYVLTTTEDLVSKFQGHLGDIFLITETDVPDRWVSATIQNRCTLVLDTLETTKADLTAYPTKSGTETISGTWTFSNGLNISTWVLKKDTSGFFVLNDGNNDLYKFGSNAIFPTTTNARDLGASSYAWKNLYLSGTVNIATYKLFEDSNYLKIFKGSDSIAWFDNSKMMTRHIYPLSTETFDLGSSTSKWRDLFLKRNLSVQGIIYGATYNFTIDSAYKLLYGIYKTNDDTTLEFERINVYSKSVNTTFAFATAPTGCYPEYKAIITNTANSAITLTFTGVAHILCNDDNIGITNGTNSSLVLPSGVSIEVSVMNNNMVAINFSAN